MIDLREKNHEKTSDEKATDRKEINLCKREAMSVCTAQNSKEQEECDFYDKSSVGNRCMYFIFDEHCDCLKAQMESKGE